MNCSNFLLKTFFSFNYLPVRCFKQLPSGIQYPGFTYYPRTHNFKDPPYEPSKLFLVIRIKSMKGRDPIERQALALLNIDGDKKFNKHINVVKNIPPINAHLWKVKHLVEIKPIIYKGELPKDGDYTGTFLRLTGELVMSPRFKITPDQMEATEKYLDQTNKLNRKYFKEYLKKKWLLSFSGDVKLF